MTTRAQNVIARFLPSLSDVAFLLPIAFLFLRLKGASGLLGDGDTGWHIRTGEWILANRRVPTVDMFSYTMPGKAWFAWEWLWDVLFASIHQRLGMQGVVFVNICILSVIYLLLFRLIRRAGGNDVIAIALTLLAMIASSVHWLARPHLLSWLFPLIFLMILERVREGRQGLLWLLPILTILWVNLHGGFFVGIVTVAIYGGSSFLNLLIFKDNAASAIRAALPCLWTSLACLAASFVNPYGWLLHKHLIAYLSDSAALGKIQEFQSLSFHSPVAIFFEAVLFLGWAAALWAIIKRDATWSIMVLLWSHLALLAVRNVPIFVMIATPLIARMLQDVLDQLSRAPIASWMQSSAGFLRDLGKDFRPLERIPRLHLPCVFVIGLLGLLMLHGHNLPPELEARFDSPGFPSKALPTLRSILPGRIFTEDLWGGYLIYSLYPTARVYVDGRSDFYGADFINRYLDVMSANFIWERELAQNRVDTILLRVDSPLSGALKESRRWIPVYDDGASIVFRSVSARGLVTVADAGNQKKSGLPLMFRTETADQTLEQKEKHPLATTH